MRTEEDAQALRFPGSPTIRLNGADPFPHAAGVAGLTCRVYATTQGVGGAPTVEQLTKAVTTAAQGR